MMDQDNNRLDEFFRNRLQNDLQEDWNTPSDKVLDNALLILKKRRRKGAFWYVRIGLIFLAVIIFIWSLSRIGYLEEQVEEMKQLQSDLDRQANYAETIPEAKQKGIDNFSDTNFHKKSLTALSGKAQQKILSAKTAAVEANAQDLRDYMNSTDQIPYKLDIFILNSRIPEFSFSRVQTTPIPGPLLRNRTLIPYQGNDSSNHGLEPSGWKLVVFGGLNWSSLSMSAAQPLPDNLKEYHNWYMGYQYGLGIHRELTGRWSVGLGISYNQFENRSKFRNNETYDSANEAANTNGDLIYSSQFNFESPMEPLSIGIVFSPEGKNLQDGDLMQAEMGIMQKFHVWVADIQFSYLMINNGNWKFGLSAGTGLNFISDIGQVLDFELSRNGSLIDNRSFSSRVRQYSRFFPSYLAGLDLAYFHGPFDFGMSFSYGGSLGSIRPVDSVMKVKTNLTSVSGNFKVAWRFR